MAAPNSGMSSGNYASMTQFPEGAPSEAASAEPGDPTTTATTQQQHRTQATQKTPLLDSSATAADASSTADSSSSAAAAAASLPTAEADGSAAAAAVPKAKLPGAVPAATMGTGASVMQMVKLMLGAGVLAMPHAFSKAGFWAALVLYPMLGLLCWFTVVLLLEAQSEARRRVVQGLPRPKRIAVLSCRCCRSRKRGNEAATTNGETPSAKPASSNDDDEDDDDKEADDALSPGPEDPDEDAIQAEMDGLRTYQGIGKYAMGNFGRWTVLVAVCILQLCFCIGYVIICSNTIVEYIPGIPRWAADLGIVFPLLSALACIRWIKDLYFISVFGTIVYLVGVGGATIYRAAPILANGAPDVTLPIVWATMPAFMGTALYSLEGINGVLPVAGAMRERHKAPKAMLIATLIYACSVAFFSAIAYAAGFAEYDVVTLAMPPGILRALVQWALALALLVTHPLQLYPATELIEERLFPLSSTFAKRAALRVSLVLLTCFIGGFLTTFSEFSDLVGSLFLSFAGFIMPPVLYMRIVGTSHGRAIFIGAAALALFGFFFMIFGTYRAVVEVIS